MDSHGRGSEPLPEVQCLRMQCAPFSQGLLPAIWIGSSEQGNKLRTTMALIALATSSTGSQYLGSGGYTGIGLPDIASLMIE